MLELVVNNTTEEDQLPIPIPQPKGKGPSNTDWLSGMVSGTEFLCKHKIQSTWMLTEFTHGGLKHGCVLLIPTVTLNDPRTWMWVDPVLFCAAFELRAILEVPEDDSG
jgi:hypothetical protein